jgi:hypothetical protein
MKSDQLHNLSIRINHSWAVCTVAIDDVLVLAGLSLWHKAMLLVWKSEWSILSGSIAL